MNESIVRVLKSGKTQIMRAEALCAIRQNKIINDDEKYTDVIRDLDNEIKRSNPEVKQGALNNVHGDWYEWFLAIQGWNYCSNNKEANVPLLLPNISSLDVSSLYKPYLHKLIQDLRHKVSISSTVELITSNPDFVIVKRKLVNSVIESFTGIKDLNKPLLNRLNSSYKSIIHQCDFDDIIGYISVKTSLRPDRRLQLSHEGSLMKALYVHLQTREWIIEPSGLKYYGISTKLSKADKAGLKTVATHSITSVQSRPQPAVDALFSVNSNQEARKVFEKILD